MLSPRSYYIFQISLTIIPSILFSSHFPHSAFAFQMASTTNLTTYQGESASDANTGSPPLATAIEIYIHTNKALQALSEGNTSEVENQLNFTKEKLSPIIFNNESTVASPGSDSNIATSDDTAINLAEDSTSVESALGSSDETAAIEADTPNENQGISERGMREGSEEGVP